MLKILTQIVSLLIAVVYLTLLERKVMAAIQRRRRPILVGLFGLLQPLADGLKLFFFETNQIIIANYLALYINVIKIFLFYHVIILYGLGCGVTLYILFNFLYTKLNKVIIYLDTSILYFFSANKFLKLFKNLEQIIQRFNFLKKSSYYILSFIMFIRALFGEEKENKIFGYFYTSLISFILAFSVTLHLISAQQMICFLILHGFHLYSIEIYGIIISTYLDTNKESFIATDFNLFLKTKLLHNQKTFKRFFWSRATVGAAFFGKSGLTPSGRAFIIAGGLTAGSLLLNGELDRRHERREALKNRQFEDYKMRYSSWEKRDVFNGESPPQPPKGVL